MANVVQGTSNGEYDLARSLRLYDTSGDLPGRAPRAVALIRGDAHGTGPRILAPIRQVARGPRPFDEAKIEQLADKIVPFITAKFERIDQPEWTDEGA